MHADSLRAVPLSTKGAGNANNAYRYTDKLLALEARSAPPSAHLPIQGFLPSESWGPVLASNPDQRFASFLRRGIKQGFRIGVDPAFRLQPHNLTFGLQLPMRSSSPAI